MPVSRHVGFWAIGPVVLAINSFWLVPGYLLASTKGGGENAFSHPEPVIRRLLEVVTRMPPIEAATIAFGLVGLAAMARRDIVGAAGLGGFFAAGFFWGYLAGFFRLRDPLQPGRHTLALYTAASIASGLALGEILERLGASLRPWVIVGMIVFGFRIFNYAIPYASEMIYREDPILSCRPPARLVWFVNRLRAHVKPGERLLFEESGRELTGLTDPFQGRHFSPILPHMAGVEVLGGPFLYTTVTTNFTQFGENKLFGKVGWGRDDFVRHATIYGPTAIACWTPHSRAFCEANPDLVQILEDDGTLLLGRVIGFEGKTARGTAKVEAGPNRIEIRDMVAGDDGLVVLRYHAVPNLRITPQTLWEPVFLEDDPVPFIGVRPSKDSTSILFQVSPWSGTR